MEWRYGWSADDPRWTEEQVAGDASAWTAAGTVPPASPPEISSAAPSPEFNPWQQEAWGAPPPQLPQQRPPAAGDRSVTTTGGLPALRGPSGQHVPVRAGFGLVTPPNQQPSAAQPRGRLSRAGSRTRSRATFAPPSERFTDEPRYAVLFGLTAGWYALPGIVYLVWLLTIGDERAAGNGLWSSLPWLLAALMLSFVVAGLLRWAIVGWRALTLSFAAAVIGAGVATIAHSLSL